MTWNEIAGFGKAEKILQVGRNIALRKKTDKYLIHTYQHTWLETAARESSF